MFGVGKLPLIGLENMIWHRGKGQQCSYLFNCLIVR